MNLKEWWKENGDYMGSHEDARKTWIAAMNACAEMLEKEAEELRKKSDSCPDVSEAWDLMGEHETVLRMVILIRTEIANS